MYVLTVVSWCLEGASFPRFQHPRKNLEVNMVNKEPRVYAFDDEVSFMLLAGGVESWRG